MLYVIRKANATRASPRNHRREKLTTMHLWNISEKAVHTYSLNLGTISEVMLTYVQTIIH